MERPRIIRLLRIGWTAAFAILCGLLVALWVRSHLWRDSLYGWLPTPPGFMRITSNYGGMSVITWTEHHESEWRFDSSPAKPPFVIWHHKLQHNGTTWFAHIHTPHWFLVLSSATLAVIPWVSWSRRFSLKTLLIAITLAAVLLGIIVAAV